MSKGSLKMVASGVLISFLAIYIANKVPAIRSFIGPA